MFSAFGRSGMRMPNSVWPAGRRRVSPAAPPVMLMVVGAAGGVWARATDGTPPTNSSAVASTDPRRQKDLALISLTHWTVETDDRLTNDEVCGFAIALASHDLAERHVLVRPRSAV